MAEARIDARARDDAFAELDGWCAVDGRDAIGRTFQFRSFGEAFAFMTRCALLAERMNHHPEWFNVYDRVEVILTTHAAGGVTDLDLRMARAMSRFAETPTSAAP